jgi:FtsZ-binding cell division protein ZapB
MSIYNKRSSSEALDTSSQQDTLKRMKITSSSQVVDLEEEEIKGKTCMEMVEATTKNEETNTERRPQNESSTKVFSSRKYIFGQTPGVVYQSKGDLINQYAMKGSMVNSEIRDLLPEVERTSQHKASLLSVRDVEKKTFNIAVVDDDKVSEIKMHYENIVSPDKVKFHRNVSDMLYSDYLSLALKVARLTTYASKLDGQLKQEKVSSKAWMTQVKKLESEGPQGLKASLDEKDKMIQSLKKRLKMSPTDHPQTTELVALEQEKEIFRQEALDYKAKLLQLEKEKEHWSLAQEATSDMAVIIPANTEAGSSTEGLVQAMSQVSLKTGEIKNLKENMEKMKQEMKVKDEKIAQLHRENQDLQERVNKLKTRLKGKTLLQGAKHVIWDAIAVEVAKFRVYLNFIDDKDNMVVTAQNKCVVVNEILAKKPSEWAQNAIDLLNVVPTAELQTIGVKDRTTLIISARRIIAKHNLLGSVWNKAVQMEYNIQEFKNAFEDLFVKGLPSFWDGKGSLYNQEDYHSLLMQCRMDHSKFEDMEESLKGLSLVEYLATDFEILNKFKIVKVSMPAMSYATCIDLEILIKEMMDYRIPSDPQWKEIMWLGKTKCNVPGTNR